MLFAATATNSSTFDEPARGGDEGGFSGDGGMIQAVLMLFRISGMRSVEIEVKILRRANYVPSKCCCDFRK